MNQFSSISINFKQLQLVTDKHSAHLSTLINEVNREGMTPLAVACKYNLPENVQVMNANDFF